ncbi:MAG: hypothetical protein DRQ42_00595 [Gammaproteobacteria bacterium]|nr:MAG: hypothetical protein DRQ42_00595 [Gammaproteobacteria bacterium]
MMKLLATGDWHLRNKKPKNRTDDFVEAQKNKVTFILETAKLNGCNYILQPGDLFDSYQTSDYLKQLYISLLKEYEIPMLTVFGQHDMRYHSSNRDNTPTKVLDSSGVITVLPPSPVNIWFDVHFYGCSWGEEIPEVEDKSKFNVLLIHKMIVEDKLWEGQEDHTLCNLLLRTTDFDLIVSGDNHKSFTTDFGHKALLNCGSLMRTNIDQVDHTPICFIVDIIDTGESSIVPIEIPHQVFESVFNVEKATEEKEKNAELEAFIEGLKEEEVELQGLNFRKNVDAYMAKNKTSEGVRQIINEVLA